MPATSEGQRGEFSKELRGKLARQPGPQTARQCNACQHRPEELNKRNDERMERFLVTVNTFRAMAPELNEGVEQKRNDECMERFLVTVNMFRAMATELNEGVKRAQ